MRSSHEAQRCATSATFVDRAASFAQQRFWVLAQTRDAGSAYHIAGQWDIQRRARCGRCNARSIV